MKRDIIRGSDVVYEFKVLHHEWEVDGYGWVTEDGRVWHSNHNSIHEISISELASLMDEPLNSIMQIRKAIRIANDGIERRSWGSDKESSDE